MSDSIVARASASQAAETPSRRTSLGASLALVVGFWWAATGVTLAMQRSAFASSASMVIASCLAVAGAVLIINTRNDSSVQSARLAFLGSSFIWWWCSTLFYAGVGIEIASGVPSETRTWSLAMQAIGATLRADLFGVAALMAVAAVVWRSANRVALWTLLVFWATLQTAKLNVFMGVRNSGVDWLPDHLAPLSQFFGPAENSWLLPVTIAALMLNLVHVTRRARSASHPFARHAGAMIALLLALAVVEHVFLGLSMSLPLWEVFKSA